MQLRALAAACGHNMSRLHFCGTDFAVARKRRRLKLQALSLVFLGLLSVSGGTSLSDLIADSMRRCCACNCYAALNGSIRKATK